MVMGLLSYTVIKFFLKKFVNSLIQSYQNSQKKTLTWVCTKESKYLIQMKNNYQETHGSAAIRQHVEHGSELGGLVQEPGRVTINGIKKAAQLKGNYTSC